MEVVQTLLQQHADVSICDAVCIINNHTDPLLLCMYVCGGGVGVGVGVYGWMDGWVGGWVDGCMYV